MRTVASRGPQTVAEEQEIRYVPKFVVQGGKRLSGRIRPAGNKNAALPMLAAALLTEDEVVLENVPEIRDVQTLMNLLEALGVEVEWTGRNVVRLRARELSPRNLDPVAAAQIRASILLAGPMVARTGGMQLPPPGGDIIGRRRMDTHFLAFKALGAEMGFRREIYGLHAEKGLN